MKKRKGGDVDQHGISERKRKASSLVDEQQNNKPSEFVRTVKGLLQKEQTRLAGMLKIGKKRYFNFLFFHNITVFAL